MFYEFKATYWDDYDDCEKEDRGLVFAKDYGKAAKKVSAAYGRNIISVYLCELDAYNTITVDEIKEEFKLYS